MIQRLRFGVTNQLFSGAIEDAHAPRGIHADDPGRARSFYEELFGWRFDQILCLARGGLRVGDQLSRIFEVPLAILATSSSGWLAPSRKEKFVWQCSSA